MNLWNSKRDSALLMNIKVFALHVKALFCCFLGHMSRKFKVPESSSSITLFTGRRNHFFQLVWLCV